MNINLNDALFKLICNENYSVKNTNILIDVFKNNNLICDNDFIETIYSKYLPKFESNEHVIEIVKLLPKINIIYLYNLVITTKTNTDKIINIIKELELTESVIINALNFINNNIIKFDPIILLLLQKSNSEINKEIKKIYENTHNTEIILLILTKYTKYFIEEIKILHNENKLLSLLSNSNELIRNIFLNFDCQYNQNDIICSYNLNLFINEELRQQKINIINFCEYPIDFSEEQILDSFNYIDVAIYSKYLHKKKNRLILKKYINNLNINNLSFVNAMRILFKNIVLPIESQDIVVILDYYSEHYKNCSEISFSDSEKDLCFQLVCALLMLNTDLHNNNVKKKISKKTFIHNWYNNIDKNHKVIKKSLSIMYDEIKISEFKMIN